jgi:predicted acyltransferase
MKATLERTGAEQSPILATEENAVARTGRLLALDTFRGLTIAGMILVNNPGTWDAVYGPLRHADWHGWTPTDLIFPFFLFIVGVSIALALGRRAATGGAQGKLYLKIVRRSVIIFALGLVIYGFPYYQLSTLRIPGVLQRIAVCYLVASIVFLKTGWKGQAIIATGLLVAYWLLMILVPVPGYGAGDLSMEGNLAAYLDRQLLAGHTWKPLYDPEGLLSSVPAIATTLFGVMAGSWILSKREGLEKTVGLFVAGTAGIIIGWAWGAWFPINKALWTSSYTVLTAGMALQFLALCYWLVDIKGYRRWTGPFVIFGVNAIAVYVLSSIMATALDTWHIRGVTIKEFLYSNLFASWAAPINASLLWAISYVLFWLGVMTLLYRRKIFIKV